MIAPKDRVFVGAVPWFGRFGGAIGATVEDRWCVDVGPSAEQWVPDSFSEQSTRLWLEQLPMSSHVGDTAMRCCGLCRNPKSESKNPTVGRGLACCLP